MRQRKPCDRADCKRSRAEIQRLRSMVERLQRKNCDLNLRWLRADQKLRARKAKEAQP